MINKLIEIAKKTNSNDLLKDLEVLSGKINAENCSLILPLVGEFSSGKTTLINALTDSKLLETASRPTTSTIYQILFSREEVSVEIIKENGEIEKISDVSLLKNNELINTELVNIYDTSNKISATTILVDTPGLSSADAKHKQTLIDFLPNADGILLTIDINQQITRSLTDFMQNMKIAKRRIYLVITKCDTKPANEIKKIKENISKTTKLPIEQMFCVSAKDNSLDELYVLLESINKDKASILKEIHEEKIRNIAKLLSSRIDELLNAVYTPDSDLDSTIRIQKRELEKIKRNIEKLVDDTRYEAEKIADNITIDFNKKIFEKLDYLLANAQSHYDEQVADLINNITSLYLNKYKSEIQETLYNKANERKTSDNAVKLHSLESINLDALQLSDAIQYNLNLNKIGAEYNKKISVGAKILTLVAGGAAVAGIAIPGFGIPLAIAGLGLAGKSAVELFKTATSTNENQENIEEDFLESLISKVTKSKSSADRQVAINEYTDEVLCPYFKNEMQRLCEELTAMIKDSLEDEAESLINQKTELLTSLKEQSENQEKDFQENMEIFKQYKTELESYKDFKIEELSEVITKSVEENKAISNDESNFEIVQEAENEATKF